MQILSFLFFSQREIQVGETKQFSPGHRFRKSQSWDLNVYWLLLCGAPRGRGGLYHTVDTTWGRLTVLGAGQVSPHPILFWGAKQMWTLVYSWGPQVAPRGSGWGSKEPRPTVAGLGCEEAQIRAKLINLRERLSLRDLAQRCEGNE